MSYGDVLQYNIIVQYQTNNLKSEQPNKFRSILPGNLRGTESKFRFLLRLLVDFAWEQ